MTEDERLAKITKLLKDFSGDPYIGKGIVDLELYKDYRKKKQYDALSSYRSGTFTIKEINPEGYIVIEQNNLTPCKVLIRTSLMHFMKIGDKINCKLKRKIFFVYWDIEIFNKYIIKEEEEIYVATNP